MVHIVPADVLALLAEQSLAAVQGLSHAPRAHVPAPPARVPTVPATTSGMTPFGAILDTTRFSLTAQGLEALAAYQSTEADARAAASPAAVCPCCGGALVTDYEPGLRAAFLVCENNWSLDRLCTYQRNAEVAR